MITHPSHSRGYANHGWLKSHHTFSFANYYNPERMNFGALRVLNDDSVDGGNGFGTHPHRDMEIVSIPLKGVLKHQDSEGNRYLIKKGEVQIMSAGTGIAHSEENASDSEDVKFLQIWVMPKKLGVKPRYEQKEFSYQDDALTMVVSPDGRGGSLTINQEAYFSMAHLSAGKALDYNVQTAKNGVYLFVLEGEVEVNGTTLKTRDGLGIPVLTEVVVNAQSKSEVLIIEVPMEGYNS